MKSEIFVHFSGKWSFSDVLVFVDWRDIFENKFWMERRLLFCCLCLRFSKSSHSGAK